jgi:hypothetical protein
VTIVFAGVKNHTELLAKVPNAAQDAQDMLMSTISQTARDYDGVCVVCLACVCLCVFGVCCVCVWRVLCMRVPIY